MNRWQLSRRTLLRGAGAALALPLLEQMLPARAWAAQPPPVRLLAFYVPNGMRMSAWTPSQTGSNYTMSKILQPLQPLRNELLVLSGLANTPANPNGNGAHAYGTSGFLSCTSVKRTGDVDVRAGITVDQVAATHLKGTTPFSSWELGTDGGNNAGACDVTLSCAYTRTISWSSPTSPRAKEVDPRAAFERLFGDDGTPEQASRRRALRLSVLDAVGEDTRRLKARLGTTDGQRLDEYLTGIRELEQRISAQASNVQCDASGFAVSGDGFVQRTAAFLDLMVLAFKCDLTRVITFMLGNGQSYRVFDFLGLNSPHHAYSHHKNEQANLAALETIGIWELQQFAALLGKLAASKEPDGSSLLDNALVLFGSELADPQSHQYVNLPILLAGRGGGAIKPGRHIQYSGGEPLANLHISLLQALGYPAQTFGDNGYRPLPGLTS